MAVAQLDSARMACGLTASTVAQAEIRTPLCELTQDSTSASLCSQHRETAKVAAAGVCCRIVRRQRTQRR